MREMNTLIAEFLKLSEIARTATLRCADIVAKIRERSADCLAWLEVCTQKLHISRRYSFLCLRVSAFVEKLRSAHDDALLKSVSLNDLTKIEILSFIPIDRLKEFLSTVDMVEITREELRTTVAKFLGKARASAQLDFFAKLRLPDFDRFTEIVSDRSAAPVDKLAAYGQIMHRAAAKRLTEMSPSDQIVFKENLAVIVKEATGFNVAPFILEQKRK